MLGANKIPPQFGIIGRYGHQTVGIDLNGCNTISLFGVQGYGKSYSLGTIQEGAVTRIPMINTLKMPLATVVFHYHPSDSYKPEFLAATSPNANRSELVRLREEYGAEPKAIEDIVILCPEDAVERRKKEYPTLQVHPIKFNSTELKGTGWKFLLGAYGNESLYLRQLSMMLRKRRDDLTIDILREDVKNSGLSDNIRALVEDRIKIAEQYIDDSQCVGDLMQPGRTVIVDMRDAWIEKLEALEIFVVLMMVFAAAGRDKYGEEFSKLIIFDEAHKYIEEGEIVKQLVTMIREMRHLQTSIIIASQDPLSIPSIVVELSTVLILHRMTSPAWVKHLKGSVFALEELNDMELARLEPGEALIWTQKSTNKTFMERPQRVSMRPRVSAHGGGTKTAVKPAETKKVSAP